VLGDLNDARALCATYGNAYTMLGQIEYRFFDRVVGLDHLRTGWRLSRNDSTAAYAAGEADAIQGKWDAAAEKFQAALALDESVATDVIDAYLNQFDRPELAADAVGDNYLALVELRNALRADPNNARWKKLSDDVEIKAFDLLEKQGNEPGAPAWKIVHVGNFRWNQGRLEEAEKYYARGIDLEPHNMQWRLEHAELLYKMGRYKEAIDAARTAVRMQPLNAEAKKLLEKFTAGKAPAP
jgi:tetratricopeptide (TPR) repeat protein